VGGQERAYQALVEAPGFAEPDRAEASKAEAAKLGVQVRELFYTPGGPHDAAIVIEAEGPEPINKLMCSVQSLGNVKMKFVRAFSIEEMRKMV